MNDNKMSIELSLDTKDYDKKVDDAMRRLSDLEKSLGKEHELDIPVKTDLQVLKEQLEQALSQSQAKIADITSELKEMEHGLSWAIKDIKYFDKLPDGLGEWQKSMAEIKALDYSTGIENLKEKLKDATEESNSLKEQLENINNIETSNATEEIKNNTDEAVENTKEIANETDESISKWEILSGLISMATSGIKKIVSGMMNVAKRTKDTISKMNPLTKIIDRVKRSISRQVFTTIASLLNPLNQFKKVFSYLTDVLSPRLGATFKNIGNNLTEYIANSPGFKNLINDVLYFIKLLEIAFNKLASLLGIAKIDLFKKSAKSAKEMGKGASQALASIDEITNLNSGGGNDSSPFSSDELFSGKDLDLSIFDYINEKIYKLRDTLLEIDFYSIGNKLAEGINTIVTEIDWPAIINTVSIGFQSLLDTITGFFDGLDTKKIGKTISDIFANLELGNIGTKLSNAMTSILSSISSLLSEIDWEELGNQIADFILNIDWVGLITKIIELIGNILISAGELLWGIIEPILSNLWNKFYSWFSSTPFGKTIINMFDAAFKAVKAIWDFLSPYFETLFNVVIEIAEPVWDQVVNIFSTAWELIKIVWDAVSDYFTTLWNNIAAIFSVVKSVLSGDFKGAWDGIKEIWDNVSGYFERVWERIKSTFSVVGTFFKNTFQNAWNGVKKVFEGVKTFFDTYVVSPIKGILNTILGFFESAVNKIVSGLNVLIKGINKISFDVPDWVPVIGGKKWGFDIKSLNEVKLPRLDVGTNYVPKDSLAMIHQGEAIVPKKFNDREFFGTGNEETNSLLEQLLDKVDNIDFSPYIGIKDVGKAAVSYINETSRQTGRRLV